MQKILIRHGEKDEKAPHEYGNPPVTFAAVLDAQQIGWHFKPKHGFHLPTTMAVSESMRTHQTAKALGALNVEVYPELNEVHPNIKDPELYAMLKRGEIPEIMLEAGEKLRANPPEQQVWVGHELSIAGFTAVVALHEGRKLSDVAKEIRLAPALLEVRFLEVPTVLA